LKHVDLEWKFHSQKGTVSYGKLKRGKKAFIKD